MSERGTEIVVSIRRSNYLISEHPSNSGMVRIDSDKSWSMSRSEMILLNRLAQDLEAHLATLAVARKEAEKAQTGTWPRTCGNCGIHVPRLGPGSYVIREDFKSCPKCGNSIEIDGDPGSIKSVPPTQTAEGQRLKLEHATELRR